jgi:hypothetical protein
MGRGVKILVEVFEKDAECRMLQNIWQIFLNKNGSEILDLKTPRCHISTNIAQSLSGWLELTFEPNLHPKSSYSFLF